MDKRIVSLLALFLVGINAQAAPRFVLPAEVSLSPIGQQIETNGMPMEVWAFVSDKRPAEILSLFKSSLGEPLVENRMGHKYVLGRMKDGEYITVQIEPSARGSRGAVAISDLRKAKDSKRREEALRQEISNMFSADTRVLGSVKSRDAGRHSHYVMLENASSEDVNVSHLDDYMKRHGLQMERKIPGSIEDSRKQVLHFRGAAKEAMALVFRKEDGKTAVVFNLVSGSQ